MTFKCQQKALINFLSGNYKKYLSDSFPEPEITDEFLDFDRFKNDFTLFVDFARIDFRQSAYQDDCGDSEHLSLTVFLVRRNSESKTLRDDVLDAAWAFYKMVKENPGLGIAQNTVIDGIDFYNYVEGTKYLVCSEINLSLDVEIQTIQVEAENET
ncbi:MAG: hypothetical protein LBF78_12850 [Treponema sp.]|jgi:hypothetical protein|nr:hypothetical protein [Treponema sp.]